MSEAWDENIVLGWMLTVAESSLRGTHHTLMKELSRRRRWENILAQHQTLQKPAPAYLDQCSGCHQPVELCRCKMSSKKRGTHSAGIRGCGVPTAQESGAAGYPQRGDLGLLAKRLWLFSLCASGFQSAIQVVSSSGLLHTAILMR